MMNLPVISGRECVKALCKAGFYIRRQNSSHIILRKDVPFHQIVVPDHKTLDRVTLRAILRQAELSIDEFCRLM